MAFHSAPIHAFSNSSDLR